MNKISDSRKEGKNVKLKNPKNKIQHEKNAYRRVKVPSILQMEAVECGAASLAMILAYYGKYVPLEEMRTSCGVSRDGSKASNLCKAARKYGLEVKAYRKEPSELKKMQGPMIVHWNFNHFVVLEGFQRGKVYLKDPSMGASVVTEEEFDQSFTGVVLTFTKGSHFTKGGKPSSMMGTLIRHTKGSRAAMLFIILTGLALVLPGLVLPVFSKIFLDEILLGGKSDWMFPLVLGMGITAIFRGLLTWLREYYLLKLQNKIAVTESGKFLWHVLRMPVEFFSQRSAGDISSRMLSNNTVAEVISGQLTATVLNIVMLIFYFILMLQYSPLMTMIAVLSAVLQIIYLKKTSSYRKDKNKKLLQDNGKLVGTAMSGLISMETLKATGAEGDFFSKWSGYHAKVMNGTQDMEISAGYLSAVPTLIMTLTNTLVLLIGGYSIMDGNMTVGLLVAFQSLMASFLEPVAGLLNMGSVIQNLEGDINRLDDVYHYPEDKMLESEKISYESYEQKQKLEGTIEVKNISFGYNVLEKPLIENFSLSLKPGARVALVGASGSGKSTVGKLISGILIPWSGEILFDGKPRTEIPRNILTSSIAVVDQDICMVNDTIKNNLTLWDETITEPDMIKAAKDAVIHDDITIRPAGYENCLDEGGRNLSGGQRQRIEIARALVNNPSILILDEATSALDPDTEMILDKNLRRRGCTCVIVAHRLSTIRDCDEIIVLNKGKIVQRGTHEELKREEGYYAQLIRAV
jgi:NHLM bacteriocin system ABC transporter peptidase/ATP-binding protein